jgi:hypothetical protein
MLAHSRKLSCSPSLVSVKLGDPIKKTVGVIFFFIKISIPINLERYKEFLKLVNKLRASSLASAAACGSRPLPQFNPTPLDSSFHLVAPVVLPHLNPNLLHSSFRWLCTGCHRRAEWAAPPNRCAYLKTSVDFPPM